MTNKLRVGVIGLGNMGQNHLRVYSELDDIQLVSTAEINQELLFKISQRYHLKPYADYREMIAKEKLDLISVVIPSKFHFMVSRELLQKGIHVLVEKPFTSTLLEAKTLINLAAKNKLILGVGHVERFNPVINALKEKIDKKGGKVFQITIRRIGPFPARITDVGVLLDLATHDIDILNYLVHSEIKEIHSGASKAINQRFEDLASSIIKFKNGTLAILVENWISPTKIRDIIVNCKNGMYLADLISQDLYFYENNYSPPLWHSLSNFRGMVEGNMIRYHILRSEPLKLELQAFIKAVKNNTQFPVTGEDGLYAIKVAKIMAKKSGIY